jgi:hypothetical protein
MADPPGLDQAGACLREHDEDVRPRQSKERGNDRTVEQKLRSWGDVRFSYRVRQSHRFLFGAYCMAPFPYIYDGGNDYIYDIGHV